MITYIADTAHYNDVLSRMARIEHTLWIGTANIKDLYAKVGTLRKPFLTVLDILVQYGVEVRLLQPKSRDLISAKISTAIPHCGAG